MVGKLTARMSTGGKAPKKYLQETPVAELCTEQSHAKKPRLEEQVLDLESRLEELQRNFLAFQEEMEAKFSEQAKEIERLGQGLFISDEPKTMQEVDLGFETENDEPSYSPSSPTHTSCPSYSPSSPQNQPPSPFHYNVVNPTEFFPTEFFQH